MGVTSTTLAESGVDLEDVLDTVDLVLAAARELVGDASVRPTDELAGQDLHNLARAIDVADEGDELEGADRLNCVWPVFVFSHRLVGDEAGTRLYVHAPAQKRRWLSRRQLEADTAATQRLADLSASVEQCGAAVRTAGA